MNKEQALKILQEVPVTSGSTYDLIQHIIYTVVALDPDMDLPPPNSFEAGDLFRVLCLEEGFNLTQAEEVYDAAMEIVNCVERTNQQIAS